MNIDYERQLFESSFDDLNTVRNDQGGYESGLTSLMWEGWLRCAARIPERRDLNDPRCAEDEPRLCASNRRYWRMGFNSSVESANP